MIGKIIGKSDLVEGKKINKEKSNSTEGYSVSLIVS